MATLDIILSQKDNFFTDLVRYFKNQADKIQSEALSANIYDNKGDIGTKRENILYDFLGAHIPARCNVIKGGFVFDSLGNKSNQIDLMVTNDQTFQFKESLGIKTKSFTCVEGCYALISVKSFLDKNGLLDSIKNLASVSNTKKIKVHPFMTNAQDMINQIPQRFIFAFDGVDMESVKKTCLEYYSTPRLEPKPDLILVNNKYYFARAGVLGMELPTGEIIPHGQYVCIDNSESKYVGGTGLQQLIARIITTSTFSPHMEIDFLAYWKKIDEATQALHNI